MNTLKDYLRQKFIAQYSGISDNAPEAYELWESRLDIDELIDYAEQWGDFVTKTLKK